MEWTQQTAVSCCWSISAPKVDSFMSNYSRRTRNANICGTMTENIESTFQRQI